MTDKPDYEIGYGKPPKATRFQKGRSGNPKGRPRGIPSAKALITKALAEKVHVRENGKRRTVSKAEAMITQQVNKAAAGDLKAFTQLIPFLTQGEDSALAFSSEADQQVSQSILRYLRKKSVSETHHES